MKIMFAGPSGIGKTTLAEWLATELGYEFVSGSVSDLIPSTKEMTHEEMLGRDSKELEREDWQVMNLRNKKFKDLENFVSDRSYLDLSAYYLYKQAAKVPGCEIEHFLSMCSMLTCQQCDLLVLLLLDDKDLNKWITEDNKKRITSNYFQNLMSNIMYNNLGLMGYNEFGRYNSISKGLFKEYSIKKPVGRGRIETVYGNTEVIVITELNIDIRKEILKLVTCQLRKK